MVVEVMAVKDDRLYRTYMLLLWEVLEDKLGKKQADLIMGKIYNKFTAAGKKDIKSVAYAVLKEELGDEGIAIIDEVDREFEQIKRKIASVQKTGLAITVALIFLVGFSVAVKALNFLTIPLIVVLLFLPVILMLYTQNALSAVFVRRKHKE
jgi:hypothetical protein